MPCGQRYSACMNYLFRWLAAFNLCALCLLTSAFAQSCAELSHPRSVADSQGCLAVVPVSDLPGQRRVVVALLHGDSGGALEQRHVERWKAIGATLSAPGRVVVFLLRPGYHSPAGNSSGWANPRDDDYTSVNVDRVAQALRNLRKVYQADNVILVGHSGGAAISALILGQHPDAADGALMLGCPCDVPPWREHRNSQRGGRSEGWTHSLNPLDAVAGLRPGTPVFIATGELDDNTLAKFGKRWSDAAAAQGANAQFEAVAERDHASIQRWPLIGQRVEALLKALP